MITYYLKKVRENQLFLFSIAFVITTGVIIGIKTTFALDQVDLFFSPANANLPPNQTVNLMLDAKSQNIGFVHIELTFDPSLVNLTDEITTTNSLKTIVTKTTRNSANTTGRIILVLALSPDDIATPPTGLIELANLPFGSVTGQENVTTNVTIDTPTVQIVDLTEVELSYTTPLATLALNVAATPTPTEIPSSTPTPTAILSPTPTIEVSPTPTEEVTPTPTISPTPTLTPTPLPSATPSPSPTPAVEEAVLSFVGTPPAFVGEAFPVTLRLTTSASILGVDAVILFNPATLTIQSIEDKQLLDATISTSFNNTTGIIRVSQVENPGGGFQGSGDLAVITFQGQSVGADVMLFQFSQGATSDSNAIRLSDGEDILIQPLPLAYDVYQKINLSLAFSTPSRSGYDYAGTLSQVNGSFTTGFISNEEGTAGKWPIDYNLNAQNISYSIKVSGYLKKNAQVTLVGGDNTLNFGSLLAGDANDDGIVNNVDLSIMYADWSGSGISDYNRDGIVNSADHWHIVQNFFKVDD